MCRESTLNRNVCDLEINQVMRYLTYETPKKHYLNTEFLILYLSSRRDLVHAYNIIFVQFLTGTLKKLPDLRDYTS